MRVTNAWVHEQKDDCICLINKLSKKFGNRIMTRQTQNKSVTIVTANGVEPCIIDDFISQSNNDNCCTITNGQLLSSKNCETFGPLLNDLFKVFKDTIEIISLTPDRTIILSKNDETAQRLKKFLKS